MPNATSSPGTPQPSRNLLLVIGSALVGAFLVVLILALTGTFDAGSNDAGGANSNRADAREVSAAELRDYARSTGHAVYWLGRAPGRRLELTDARGNVWVRYLPSDAEVGDARPSFTTVGTYPFDSPLGEVQRRTKAPGTASSKASNGGRAVWSTNMPTSVYVAYPDSNLLIEVYSPDPSRARRLALSHELQAIR